MSYFSTHLARQLLVTAAVVVAISLLAVPAHAQFVIAQSSPEYLAFEAEQYDSLTGDPATGFILVDAGDNQINLMEDLGVSTSESLALAEDSNASGNDGPAAMFDQVGGPQTDLINYKLEFSDPGTYYAYLHYSLFELTGDGAYGNEDSVFFPRDFGLDPSGPLSDNNFWAITPSGTPQFPAGQSGSPTEGNFMWVKVADNAVGQAGSWVYEPQVNTVLDFSIAARENGTTLDKLVFSPNPDLTAEELDQIPSYIPLPPGAVLGDFNADGAIDLADFAIMTENFNTKLASPEEAFSKGDMNANLRVELRDFVAFRELFAEQAAAGQAASVPEPAALTLAGFGLATATYLVRRRRKTDLP